MSCIRVRLWFPFAILLSLYSRLLAFLTLSGPAKVLHNDSGMKNIYFYIIYRDLG